MVNSQHYSKFFEQPITTTTTTTTAIKTPTQNQSISSSYSSKSPTPTPTPTPTTSHQQQSKSKPKLFSNGLTSTSSFGGANSNGGGGGGSAFPVKCEICSKSVMNTHLPPLVELIQHLKNEHDITNVCTNCGAFFSNHIDLKSHLVEEQHYHHHHHHHHHHNSTINSRHNQPSKKLKSNPIQTTYNNNHYPKPSPPLSTLVQLPHTKSTTGLLNTCSPVSSSSSSSSSSNSSTNSPSPKHNNNHHPLLALQMFVNGTSDITMANKSLPPSSSSSSTLTTMQPLLLPVESSSSVQALTRDIKLPAKKRPYKDDEDGEEEDDSYSLPPSWSSSLSTSSLLDECEEAKSVKREELLSQSNRNVKQIKLEIKTEKVEHDNDDDDDDDDKKLIPNQMKFRQNVPDVKPFAQKQQPLHLLQRMHLNLENYLLS
jgi:hypothetical protein